MNRRAKSCGKDGQKAPLHSFNNNKLDDRDYFQQNAKTSVASLRGLIGYPTHQRWTIFIAIPFSNHRLVGGKLGQVDTNTQSSLGLDECIRRLLLQGNKLLPTKLLRDKSTKPPKPTIGGNPN